MAPQAVVVVQSAELSEDDPTKVILTTLPQSEIQYTLAVTDVQDLSGNQVVPPDRQQPFAVTFLGTGPNGPHGDTDGDGLSDVAEQRGWVVTVDLANGGTTQREVTSEPFASDSDEDGVSDKDEKVYLTDPRNADTDGDDLTDDQELNHIYSDPLAQDSDGDTFADGLEFDFFRTSPVLADTDGDGFTDEYERTAANRDPRSADLPRHSISVGEVYVDLIVDYAFETVRDLSEYESQTVTTTLERSSSRESTTSDTTTTEWFVKAGTEATASGTYPGGFSASVELTAEAGVGASGVFVQNETSKQSSREAYRDSLESGAILETGETETRTVSGGNLVVPLMLENTGDISFTMSDVELTALMPDPGDPSEFVPIGTLVADDTVDTSTTYNLGTIDTRLGPFRFKTSDDSINPDLIEALLRNPQGIIVKVSNFSVTDEVGNAFTYQQQSVTERTAPVVIDFGGGEVERTWAAIGTGRRLDTDDDGDVDDDDQRAIFDATGKPAGVTLLEVLGEVMGLERIDLDQRTDVTDEAAISRSFATETVGGVLTITRIRDTANDTQSGQRQRAWVLLTREGYDDRLAVDEVVLSRGRGVTLAYVVDDDDDRVPKRIEVLYGSSDTDEDTDGDGLADFVEIYEGHSVTVGERLPVEVFSSPAFADIDGDGLDDEAERNAAWGDGVGPTDPGDADTDGDGACDGDGMPGCPVDTHPLDPDRSGRPELLGEFLFSGNADDTSGNAYNGSLRGDCVSLATDRFGFAGHAYLFNAGGCSEFGDGHGRIFTPHLDVSESFSFAAWVHLASSDAGWIAGQDDDGAFLDTDDASWARLFYGRSHLDGVGENGKVSFFVPGADDLLVTDPTALVEDVWTFYAVSVSANDGGTTARLYRNGALVAEQTEATVYSNPSDDPFHIGALGEDPVAFSGRIDDVRVYGGPLSATNVRELYEEGGYTP